MWDRLFAILKAEGISADVHLEDGEFTVVLHTQDRELIERILWKWEHEVRHLN